MICGQNMWPFWCGRSGVAVLSWFWCGRFGVAVLVVAVLVCAVMTGNPQIIR